MAITFASGDLISAPVDPNSFFFRIKTSQASSNVGLLGQHNAVNSESGFTLFMNNTAGKLSLQCKAAGTEVFPFITGTVTVNDGAWHSVGLNINYAGGAQAIYTDGAIDASGSGTSWGGTANDPRLGNMSDSFWTDYVGDMAEIAYWSDQRTNEEMAALAKGFSPRYIRRQTLLLYIPAVRVVQDIKGNTLTTSGLSVADHPRVF